jgi:hypothetical protein
MASITDSVYQNWVGTGNASQVNSLTQVTGSLAQQITTPVPAGNIGQSQPFPISHTALQEFFAYSDVNMVMSLNLQIFIFTVTSANATVGATYTNNGITFTVLATIASGTTLICSANHNTSGLAPLASGTLTKATGTGDATITFSVATVPTVPYYIFTVTSANATVGATYTNNGVTFTVVATISSGTTLLCSGPASYLSNGLQPLASGTLTKASGTGDSTITFSAASYPPLVVSLLAGQSMVWLATNYFQNPFTADLVTLYFSNSGAAQANPQIRGLRT